MAGLATTCQPANVAAAAARSANANASCRRHSSSRSALNTRRCSLVTSSSNSTRHTQQSSHADTASAAATLRSSRCSFAGRVLTVHTAPASSSSTSSYAFPSSANAARGRAALAVSSEWNLQGKDCIVTDAGSASSKLIVQRLVAAPHSCNSVILACSTMEASEQAKAELVAAGVDGAKLVSYFVAVHLLGL